VTVTESRALIGWDAIAEATPYAADTLRKLHRAALIEAGVVVIRWVGRPPKRRPVAYPHELANFFSRR